MLGLLCLSEADTDLLNSSCICLVASTHTQIHALLHARTHTRTHSLTHIRTHMAKVPQSVNGIQVVLEGKLVNLDVTSPAATLALGLMFLRTNDAAIAAAFSLPDTHFALDYVRPDFVMLRILARSLVMQDGVQASQAWVETQMPPLIKASVYMQFASVCMCVCMHECVRACASLYINA